MGLLTDLWWLSGIVIAAPIAIVSVDFLSRGEFVMGVFFLLVAGVALLLPEYVRRRMFGSATSSLEAVPVVGRRFENDEK